MNSMFCDVFGEKQNSVLPDDDHEWAPLSDTIEVFNFLDKLNLKKAVGSDDISNIIYKLAGPFICEPLCHIINSSIIERKVPSLFKRCDVTPVPKKQPASMDQLRPITLLCIPAKLLEHIILKNLKDVFISKIPAHQFAYRPKSNCTCALISLHNSVTRMLEDSSTSGVAVVSYDYSKAFDTIPHHILLAKLLHLDLPTGFVVWLNDYLSNRFQRIRVNGFLSDYLPVTSGAPQGSLLGPYLYLLMCYDFRPSHPLTDLIQYADDTTEACPLLDGSDEVFSNVIMEYDHILDWSVRNGFSLNRSKTQCIIIRKRQFHLPDTLRLPFNVQTNLKILGVIWSDDLSWIYHFQHIESKCSQRLYLLRVIKRFLSHDELWLIYVSIIESILLYAIELFGPLSPPIKNIIRRVFKRAKYIICPPFC